jgi:lactoylglutathione lyase
VDDKAQLIGINHVALEVGDLDAALDLYGRLFSFDVLGRRSQSFDFRDPWGNRFQVVGYRNIQFERAPGVRRALGIEALGKTEAARREIDERGLA